MAADYVEIYAKALSGVGSRGGEPGAQCIA
jgi:hypothetical protein